MLDRLAFTIYGRVMAEAIPTALRHAIVVLALLLAALQLEAADAYRRAALSRFTVEVPSHWTVTRHDDDPVAITFKIEEDLAGRPTAACLFRAMDAGQLLAGQSAIEIEKTRAAVISPAGMRMGLPEDERGLEWGETSMAGEKAGLLVTQNPAASVRRLSVMTMTEKATYFVVCSTHAAAFDARRPVFERIIGSLEILE